MQSIDCIVIDVAPADFQRMRHFYGGLLGLPELPAAPAPDAPAPAAPAAPAPAATDFTSDSVQPDSASPNPGPPEPDLLNPGRPDSVRPDAVPAGAAQVAPPPADEFPPPLAVFGSGRTQLHLRPCEQPSINSERRRLTLEIDSIARRSAILTDAGIDFVRRRGLAWSDVRLVLRDPAGYLIDLKQNRPL